MTPSHEVNKKQTNLFNLSVLNWDLQVVVAVAQYRSRWHKELDLNQGDLIQVLFKEDKTWWFGRLTGGDEGYFPAACVQPLQVTT